MGARVRVTPTGVDEGHRVRSRLPGEVPPIPVGLLWARRAVWRAAGQNKPWLNE